MDEIELAGRAVGRLGVTLTALRTTGMWGEPAGREAAVATIRRAVELGAGVLEVPVPFGPAADLFREAAVPEVFVAARLTAAVPALDVVGRRLGRRPDLLLADEQVLDGVQEWGVPVGAVVAHGAGTVPAGTVAAMRGGYPGSTTVRRWCEAHRIPYMATDPAVLAEGRFTIALPAPRTVAEVEELFREGGPTPPAGGPG